MPAGVSLLMGARVALDSPFKPTTAPLGAVKCPTGDIHGPPANTLESNTEYRAAPGEIYRYCS